MENIKNGIRGLGRLVIFLNLSVAYFSVAGYIHFTTRDEIRRRKKFSENAHRFTSFLCRLFRIKVSVKNEIPKDKVGLVVSNHMGFIDIMALNSLLPGLFVTSREMRETPVLGLITEFAGCVYVERRKRQNILLELEDLISYLRMGFRVVLYPEATSHNGEEILPFKRTLMSAAAYAGVPILPCVFNFVSVDGESFTKKHQDHVCYYGDIPSYLSLWRVFKLREIICEIEFLPEVFPTPDHDRGEVADRVREMIVEKFRPL